MTTRGYQVNFPIGRREDGGNSFKDDSKDGFEQPIASSTFINYSRRSNGRRSNERRNENRDHVHHRYNPYHDMSRYGPPEEGYDPYDEMSRYGPQKRCVQAYDPYDDMNRYGPSREADQVYNPYRDMSRYGPARKSKRDARRVDDSTELYGPGSKATQDDCQVGDSPGPYGPGSKAKQDKCPESSFSNGWYEASYEYEEGECRDDVMEW